MRIGSFNLENLFSRYLFRDDPHVPDEKAMLPTGVTSFDRFGNVQSEGVTQLQRNHTARVILDAQPDVLAVIEVESLKALRLFNDEYLSSYFDRMILIEGNDARGINVGLCVKRGFNARVVSVQTHADEGIDKERKIARYYNVKEQIVEARNALFSRDCLEVDLDVGVPGASTSLTFLVNHLKSQSGDDAKANNELRHKQATRVAELAELVIKRNRYPVVLGDLNADWNETFKPKDGPVGPSFAAQSLEPIRALVTKNTLVDPFPAEPRPWTHYFVAQNTTSRLDYILIDSRLAAGVRSAYYRRGISLKYSDANEDRYPCIGHVGTEASDHAAISVDLVLPPTKTTI